MIVLYRFGLKLFLKVASIPIENLCSTQQYKREMEKCGYTNVKVLEITEHVFPCLLKFVESRKTANFASVISPQRMNKTIGITKFLKYVISGNWIEYVIVVGTKT